MYAYLSRRYHWLNSEFTSPLLLLFFVPDDAQTLSEQAWTLCRVLCVERGLQGEHIQPGAIYTLAIYTQHIENIPPYSPHPPFSPIHTLIPIHSLVPSTIIISTL